MLLRHPAAALVFGLIGCASSPSRLAATEAPTGQRAPSAAVELVESWPLETSLDHPDLRDAKDVWLSLIDSARSHLEFAEYYASDSPAGTSALTPVVDAVLRATRRGVRVRWLADEKFAHTYPELLARFSAAGVLVRRLDLSKSGGILHAKYFVADDEAYLGSQNFDWRSLEHIQELGVRCAVPEVVHSLSDVFERDWAVAGNAPLPASTAPAHYPITTPMGEVTFVASPKGSLPDPQLWELPALLRLIDSAAHSVRVQLLTYRAHGGSDGDFPELEDALQRAAARGVKVELLVSDWSKRHGVVEGLQKLVGRSLAVKFLAVPPHSSGFIPFARVAHAKYLVIDGTRAWVGTSNWERAYFYASRNVGLVLEGGPLPPRLDAFFSENWSSSLVEPVDPTKTYPAPRIKE